MKNRKFLLLLILGLVVTVFSGSAYAQNYSFNVPQMYLQVDIQPDASALLIYDITFENYGSTIDIIDIGLPHDGYNTQNMQASINSTAISRIYTSEYIDVGVEIHLGNQSIPNGQQETLPTPQTS